MLFQNYKNETINSSIESSVFSTAAPFCRISEKSDFAASHPVGSLDNSATSNVVANTPPSAAGDSGTLGAGSSRQTAGFIASPTQDETYGEQGRPLDPFSKLSTVRSPSMIGSRSRQRVEPPGRGSVVGRMRGRSKMGGFLKLTVLRQDIEGTSVVMTGNSNARHRGAESQSLTQSLRPALVEHGMPIGPPDNLGGEDHHDEAKSLGLGVTVLKSTPPIPPLNHASSQIALNDEEHDEPMKDTRPSAPPHIVGSQGAPAQIKDEVAELPNSELAAPAAPANENRWEMIQIEAAADVLIGSRAGFNTLQAAASQLLGMHPEQVMTVGTPQVIAGLDEHTFDHDELLRRALRLLANPNVDGIARRQASDFIELRIRGRMASLRAG
jgi:hypothetical protein